MIDRAFLTRLRAPICAAPMFLVSGPELVVGACKAGVMAAFPAPNSRTLDDFEAWIARISAEVCDAPWAVNLITHASNDRLKAELEIVARHRPPIVITALGGPRAAIEVVHGYGGLVIADVIDLGLARKAIAAGVDGLACVSAGAGGHTGFLSPFAFVSAVRERFDGLVIIGGGIADGYGVAGAVAAGADLAYVGTRFIAAEESAAADAYKAMLIGASLDDLIVSAAVTGTPASWLKPSLAAAGYDLASAGAPPARNYGDPAEAAKRWRDIWAAGQGVGAIRAVEPVATIVETLATEYGAAAARLALTIAR
ncbi:NAD(P)H-dependent flavin oxidoreductase [Phenylobacterium montanum]|uniref:Nitronate monooxygenase n=1 Tax=Phenylobacterium montanum TaxID=2823693 RepID=A0A975G2R7_9CAUL|nr:nitronate monooxygenase [Caulobacter sp. S6]QUD89482.1 nitronate monooxygenase [Caulobacter sp. S6]